MQLDVIGVGHRFPGAPFLFKDLTLSLSDGILAGLSGSSGSGKTTLLSIIAGWIVPTEGLISSSETIRVTWVPQNPVGVHQRTALDHLVLPMLGEGLKRREAVARATNVLASFGLGDAGDRPFMALSGGEAQRLMLARATLTAATVVLIDEPTAQLDATSSRQIISVLVELAEAGRVVVVASHDRRVLDACSQQITLGE